MKKELTRVGIVTTLLLMIPLAGMLLTDSWNWGVFDFVAMGALIFGTGSAYAYATRNKPALGYRIIIGVLFLLAFLVVWAELAVGIFW